MMKIVGVNDVLFQRTLNNLAQEQSVGYDFSVLDKIFSNGMTTQAIEIIANYPLEPHNPKNAW